MEKPLYANYVLKIVLTKFIGAQIKDVENEEGVLEECVCIPLKRNNLKKNPKNHVCTYLFMNKTAKVNQYGWTHYMKMKVDPVFLAKMKDLGIENPFIGNAKQKNYIQYHDAYNKQLVKVNYYNE